MDNSVQTGTIRKRIAAVALTLMLLLSLTACGDYGSEFGVDYGHSNIYTDEEIQQAIQAVMDVFTGFPKCELLNIRYLGDEYSMDEYFEMMKKMYPESDYEQIIVFSLDFHTDPSPEESDWLEPDTYYRDFRFVLARHKTDNWAILNYGQDCLNV